MDGDSLPRVADDDLIPIRNRFAEFPYYRFLGIEIEEAKPGFARLSLPTGPRVSGGVHNSVHGGILASLADVAMLEALRPMFSEDEIPSGTLDLSLSYLRPALGEKVFIEASVLRKGRQIAVIEVSILDAEDRLCARGRVLYALRKKEPGGGESYNPHTQNPQDQNP